MPVLQSTTAALLRQLAASCSPDLAVQHQAYQAVHALVPADQHVLAWTRWAAISDAPGRYSLATLSHRDCDPDVLSDQSRVSLQDFSLQPRSAAVRLPDRPNAGLTTVRLSDYVHLLEPESPEAAHALHPDLVALISRRSLRYQFLAAYGDLPPPAPEPDGFWIQRYASACYRLVRYDGQHQTFRILGDPAVPDGPPLRYPADRWTPDAIAADAERRGVPLARVAGQPVVRPYPDPALAHSFPIDWEAGASLSPAPRPPALSS